MHNVLYETYRTGRLSRTVHAAVLEDAELHPTYHANDNRAIDKSLTQDSLWRVTSTKALENGVDLLPGPSQRVEIYDSGATHHVSPYIDAFTDLKFIPPKPISAANNQTFDAIGEGNIQVEIPNGENFTLVTLCNVLYAPNVAFTLISLSQADKAGYSTLIEDGVLYLIDRSSNTVVGKIPVQGGLWSVKLTKALENGNNLLPGNCPPIPISPHWCLRHISPSTTIPLVPKGTLIAKTLYNRFPKSHTHPTQEVGDVINPNICSPASVQAIGTNYAVMYAQEGSNVHPSMPVNLVQGKEIAHCVFTTIASSSTAEITKDPSEYVEVYDSGASCHMSPYKEAFTNLRPITPESILTGNNQTFEAVGMGNLPVKVPNGDGFTSITLSDVLYTPSITFTLISLRQIDKAGYTTLIEGGELHLIDRSDNTVVGRIPVHNNLLGVQSTKALENGTSLLPGNHTTTSRDIHTTLISYRKQQTSLQMPILELPPIPYWANDAKPVLQLPPIPSWGNHVPLLGQPTVTIGSQTTQLYTLATFRCKFDPVLKYILCEPHELLIPTSQLKKHLTEEHQDDFPAQGDRNALLKSLLSSLTDIYGLDPSQGYPELGWKLLHPVHKRVYSGRCCFLCPTFFHTNQDRQYTTHFNKFHKGMEKVNWAKLQFFDTLHQPFKSGKLYQIPNQGSPLPTLSIATNIAEPDSVVPPLDSPLNPPPPQFCQELGFVSWVEELGLEQEVVNYLTATPGTLATKNTCGKKAQLEKILLRVHHSLNSYLSSGQNWLFIYHSRLQDILGKRYYLTIIFFVLASH
jgi:hypothetical protein